MKYIFLIHGIFINWQFTFRHRSSNEAKDKAERPFGISFVKLMQPNGTTLSDKVHDLLIYRIDNKKFNENDASYLDSLPSTREELAELVSIKKNQEDFFAFNKGIEDRPSCVHILSSGIVRCISFIFF